MKSYSLSHYLVITSLLAMVFHNQIKAQVNIDAQLAPFFQGVASGDPLENRVIIWTRVTPDESLPTPDSIEVRWQVATDTLFENLTNYGSFFTNADRDYTVKIDVDGLVSNTWYYYRFYALGKYSLTGRTRTAPTTADAVEDLRFAVVSCSSFTSGYYHAYADIKERNDLRAVIHLGDYIYEGGGSGVMGPHEPSNELLTLEDYRTRHRQYKSVTALRQLHQQLPWMLVWDDHESANNSWADGADAHDSATEGSWVDRKAAAIQAYFEWMPIRQVDATDNQRIYRTIKYGSLADIILLDTRLEGRTEQTGWSGIGDPNNTILGIEQRDWLFNELSTSTAQWKIIAQQVMMAPLQAFGQPLNPDQWDGYLYERQLLFDHITDNNIDNVVVLTGDIHTSWGNDLPNDGYVASTGENSVGVEFVCTSVTSPGIPISVGQNIIAAFNPHMKYIDLTEHGYLLLDVTSNRTQGEWYYVDDLSTPVSDVNFATAYFTNDGENHLNVFETVSTPSEALFPMAPDLPQQSNKLYVKVWLQGAFDNTIGFMKRNYSTIYIPTEQPFNTQPWNYAGSEAVSASTDFSETVIDWVLVELRAGNLGDSLVAQQAALLLEDGSIVPHTAALQTGNRPILFNNVPPNDNYYIAIRARNHVDVQSAADIFVPNAPAYSFQTGVLQAMGNNAMVLLSNGEYGLYAGDFDGNGIVNFHDYNLFKANGGLSDYLPGDANVDLNVDAADFNLYQSNAAKIGVIQLRY